MVPGYGAPQLIRAINSVQMAADRCDVVIVGAGAAGLATAIFTRRLNPRLSVCVLDAARSPGAKILVSGGSRCNVTNAAVSERDFWGGPRTIVRRVLRGFPVDAATRFFAELGVALHEEADGKLFPDTNRARDVLNALLAETGRVGAQLRSGERVHDVEPLDGRFRLLHVGGATEANTVVLATGGQSLPKTGSDGAGYGIAARLGHTIVATTPGLVPLLLEDNDRAIHRELTGVSQPVELSVWVDNRVAVRLRGALLWTHSGVSGPVVLNASRHWLRAQVEGRACRVTVSFCPGRDYAEVQQNWSRTTLARPKATLQAAMTDAVPASVAAALLRRLRLESSMELAHLARDARRRLLHALTEWPLAITGSRGYSYAEVTAGGVDLTEIDPSTMESRRCPGLFFVGEILDVDGRIGGFNFQWAWSSAHTAARALATRE